MAVQRQQQRLQEKFPFLKCHLGCASSSRPTEIVSTFCHPPKQSPFPALPMTCVSSAYWDPSNTPFWVTSRNKDTARHQTSYCLSHSVAGIEGSYPL